jgi:hypothetical protein
VEAHLNDPPYGRSDIVPRTHPQFPPIEGKLRRGLVKIRPAVQMTSINSNSGDETRYGEKIIKRISGICRVLGLSAVAKLRAADVKH